MNGVGRKDCNKAEEGENKKIEIIRKYLNLWNIGNKKY